MTAASVEEGRGAVTGERGRSEECLGPQMHFLDRLDSSASLHFLIFHLFLRAIWDVCVTFIYYTVIFRCHVTRDSC